MYGRAGAALLEVIVALTILGTAGVACVVLAGESARVVQRAREADVEVRRAGAFLEAVSLWTREDLDRRLGERAQGPWRMWIGRPAPTLYEVVLVDTLTGNEVLRTSLFRPESDAVQ